MLAQFTFDKPKTPIIYDMQESNRGIDDNGYLHVENCVITSQQVNPYKGKEIKGWQELNLDPEKHYNILRPIAEIEKGMETYKNVPLTDDHVIIAPEKPMRERVLGWSGSNMAIDGDDLIGDIHVYVGKGINDIESADNDPNRGKKQLSAGYGYDLVPEKGSFKGQEYDFKMVNLKANHIALVKRGRVDGAQIADSADFKESDHPRDDQGKFAEGSGDHKNEQILYHGTPNNFEKFDLEHIGTGEGAQTHGHGIYFTTSKELANEYRTTLVGGEKGDKKSHQNLFKVKISDHKNFLDWNTPLNDQPQLLNKIKNDKEINQTINKFIIEKKMTNPDALALEKLDGFKLYGILSNQTSSKEAAKMLERAGIEGTKYKNNETEKHNAQHFVVFNPKSLTETKKLKGKELENEAQDSAPGHEQWKALGMNKVARDTAKKIMDIAKDVNFEGEEDDRIDAILKAAAELSAIQEREQVNSATDSGDNVFKKEKKVKKSLTRILMDRFLNDAKEDEEDCKMDKKARDSESVMKAMKDVAESDMTEEEKGKSLMDMVKGMKDAEESEKEPSEKVATTKDKKAKDKMKDAGTEEKVLETNKETVKSNEKAADEEEEAEDESEEDRDGQAKDSLAFDSLVAKKVSEVIRVRNHIASLCQKVVGRLSDSVMLDADPETMIDYTLKQKGQSITGKSAEVKLAMVEMLANSSAPKMHMAMDSKSTSKAKSVNLFNVMKGH